MTMDIPTRQELETRLAIAKTAAVIFDGMIAEGYILPPEMLEPTTSLGERFNAMIIAEMAE